MRTKLKAPNNVPPSNARHWADRDEDLNAIHKLLELNQQMPIAVIQGMYGIGKTELAKRYVEKYQDSYPDGILWFNFSDRDIAQQIVNFGKFELKLSLQRDNIRDQVAQVWSDWSVQSAALVIIDNLNKVDDFKTIQPLLPRKNSVRVLLTSRVRFSNIPAHTLELFALSKAVQLLENLAGAEQRQWDRTMAEKLCQEKLGRLPLAITLVGCYLANDIGLTLDGVMRRLDKKGLAAKPLSPADSSVAEWGIKAAIELTWDVFKQETQDFAVFLSLFSCSPIEWKFVEAALGSLDSDDADDMRGELLQYSFLEQSKSINNVKKIEYEMHSLIKLFCLDYIKDFTKERQEKFMNWMLSIIANKPVMFSLQLMDSFSANNPFEKILKTSKDIAKYVRECRIAWRKSIEEILLKNIPQSSGKIKIGVFRYQDEVDRSYEHIMIATYKGSQISEDYFEIPDNIQEIYSKNISNILNFWHSIEEIDHGWMSFETSILSSLPIFYEYQQLQQKLNQVIRQKGIFSLCHDSLIDETAWGAAIFVSGKYKPNSIFDISPISIKSLLDNIDNDKYFKSYVNKFEIECLRFKIAQLENQGESFLSYPWSFRENNLKQQIIYVAKIYQAALDAYASIIQKYFQKFSNYCPLMKLFPLEIRGKIIHNTTNVIRVAWYFFPSPDTRNRCRFKISQSDFSQQELHEVHKEVDQVLGKQYLLSIYKSNVLVNKIYPVNYLVYEWLWKDLTEIGWLPSNIQKPHF